MSTSDCASSFNNPAEEYNPARGAVFIVRTVVHVITNGASTSSSGYLSPACVRDGIAMLNHDFRATLGTKGAGGADTRREHLH
jgi:hypothetical protein